MIIKNHIHDVVVVETNVIVLPFGVVLAYAILTCINKNQEGSRNNVILAFKRGQGSFI
jgi:hypothetical protein